MIGRTERWRSIGPQDRLATTALTRIEPVLKAVAPVAPIPVLAAALLASSVLMVAMSQAAADDVTWLASPGSNDYGAGSNWSTGSAPGGTASFDARISPVYRLRPPRRGGQAALNGKIEPRETEQLRFTPAKNGSLRWLIEQYYASAEFKRLDTSTKSARRGILDNLCNEPVSDENSNPIGSLPYASMPTSKVRALRDRKAELPEAANGRIKALRQVFRYAIAAEHPGAERNPARDVPYMKTGSHGFHTWTIAEVQQYAKKHPISTKAHLALALLLFTGQRRSDVVKFGRQHLKNGWLTFTQVKNRKTKPVTCRSRSCPGCNLQSTRRHVAI